jgi:hypothetical protein
MIPPVTTHTVTLGGAQASASFGISAADEAHLMGILREGLYSDKILAILREYGSNAWDAHRSAGKHELPILGSRACKVYTVQQWLGDKFVGFHVGAISDDRVAVLER